MRLRAARVVRWAGLCATTLAYIATGKLGLALAVVNASASAVWMPTGIALAILLIAGRGAWPWVFVGAFVVNITTAGTTLTSLGIAGGNTLEALVGAWLIERLARGRQAFDLPHTVFLCVPIAMALAAVSASTGVVVLDLAGMVGRSGCWPVWSTWWLGDAVGAIMACPVIVLWANHGWPRWKVRAGLESLGVMLSTLAVGLLVFEGGIGAAGHGSDRLVFIAPLPVLWACLRLGRAQAASITVLLMVIALDGTHRGQGPFVSPSPNESLLWLQSFMATTSIMALVVAAVVEERNRLQTQLALRARDLARSNQELEQFAYVAAHDLQEPIRMIITYLQLIERRIDAHLDERTRGQVAFVSASARRMQAMVRSILEYSLLGHSAAPATRVDMGLALGQALENLESSVATAHAQVEVGDLPTITGDLLQLVRLFQNLVSNALKFRSERPVHIRISARRLVSAWEFCVADNGIGIGPDGRAKLFGFFQRLHAVDEYPGTGIGLAACKKIVELHGGSIGLTSEPGLGTTVSFTLPA